MEEISQEKSEIAITKRIALTLAARNKLIIYILSLMIINFTISTLGDSKYARDIEGHGVSPKEYKEASIKTMLWGIPILSAIIALVLNFIPFKKFSYRQKFLRTWLITMLTIHVGFLSAGIYGLVR